ncbi:MAG TPA: hypothetical protein VEA59_06360 [Patescibacteria group bacterium]|nr:hypothetical protein [Patescibacteria group bacterium]
MEHNLALSLFSVVLTVVSFAWYCFHIFKGTDRPHAFSWGIWALITGIAFGVQLTQQAGIASVALGAHALTCGIIASIGVYKKNFAYSLVDWLSLVGALVSIALWLFFKEPLQAVILLCVIDIFAFIPSFRKGFRKPFEDNVIKFLLDVVKFIPPLFALESYSIANWLYIACIIATNTAFALWLLVRRYQTKHRFT